VGARQAIVPVVVGAWLSVFPVVEARCQPTELFGFIGNDTCSEISVGDFLDLSCPGGLWQLFRGRVAWAPLRYVGPITISVDSRRSAGISIPLYVEIVPVASHPPELSYCDGSGIAIVQFEGHSQCDAYETIEPIDLSWFLAPGDSYVVRVLFLSAPMTAIHSAHFRRIRVSPVPTSVDTEASARPYSWGMVKALYGSP